VLRNNFLYAWDHPVSVCLAAHGVWVKPQVSGVQSSEPLFHATILPMIAVATGSFFTRPDRPSRQDLQLFGIPAQLVGDPAGSSLHGRLAIWRCRLFHDLLLAAFKHLAEFEEAALIEGAGAGTSSAGDPSLLMRPPFSSWSCHDQLLQARGSHFHSHQGGPDNASSLLLY